MSDDQVEILVQQFRELAPEDQGLVMALVSRLHGGPELAQFPPDVPFMEFDE